MAVSRARQKAAAQALIAAVPGITTVYTYEPHPDSPEIQQQTYAIVDVFDSEEKPAGGTQGAPYNQQFRTVIIHLVCNSIAIDEHDNATRASLEASFDTLKDAVEAKIRSVTRVNDATGTVFQAWGLPTKSLDEVVQYGADRTLQQAWFAVRGWCMQS